MKNMYLKLRFNKFKYGYNTCFSIKSNNMLIAKDSVDWIVDNK